MCKVLAIQGSYRINGITTKMLQYATDICEQKGHQVTYLNLFDKKIDYCKGCRACLKTCECVMKQDDMKEVTEMVKNTDVIILAAPVYWANVPAVVKNLFDRMSGASMEETNRFPKPRLKGKQYIFLSACNTPMPFASFCGQITGIRRAVKEYFKTSGVKEIGMVFCDNTGKRKEISLKKRRRIEKLISKIEKRE